MASSEVEWLDGGITAVPGILAGGIAAGIKLSGKKDLALIYSSTPARAAAVFTSNQVKGAPVLVSSEHVRGGQAQAIVASSGCANVCTGEQGIADAREMTRLVGDLLRIPAGHVLVAATVASDQSTSDTVAVLTNGLAENTPLEAGSRGLRQFAAGLDAVMTKLARMLVGDGEGATKLVTVAVRGAASGRDALNAARAVANSPLVKTATNGQDPNWGRIMMALGKSPARHDPAKVGIAFGDEPLVERGMLKEGVRLERVREIMGLSEYEIRIDLGLGRGEDRVWTCDLTEEYVRLNAKYTT